MKVVIILGNAAVGKMTVGQELMKITNLRLFHNHMTIEPVIEIFGKFNMDITMKLRNLIFEEFAKSDCYGLIHTVMFAFDCDDDWKYLEHIKSFFSSDTEFYYVELVAPQKIRLERNVTENRLKNKPSKKDIAFSNARLLSDDEKYRLESFDGEVPFENYIKINNSELSADIVAQMIKDRFSL